MKRTKCGGWPYGQPPNVQLEINRDSPQADGLELWLPWGGSTPGAHRHVDRVKGLVFTEGGTPVWVADGERGWALLFDPGSSEYLEVDQAVVSGTPFSVSIRFYCTAAAQNNDFCLFQLADKDVSNHYFRMGASDSWFGTNAKIQAAINAGGNFTGAVTTSNFSLNTWHHALAVWASPTSRYVYLDGGNKGTDATDRTPSGMDRTSIGREGDSSPSDYWDGKIADVRVYNRALTDTEAQQFCAEPWELYKPLTRRFLGWSPPAAALPIFSDQDIHSLVFGGVTVR